MSNKTWQKPHKERAAEEREERREIAEYLKDTKAYQRYFKDIRQYLEWILYCLIFLCLIAAGLFARLVFTNLW